MELEDMLLPKLEPDAERDDPRSLDDDDDEYFLDDDDVPGLLVDPLPPNFPKSFAPDDDEVPNADGAGVGLDDDDDDGANAEPLFLRLLVPWRADDPPFRADDILITSYDEPKLPLRK